MKHFFPSFVAAIILFSSQGCERSGEKKDDTPVTPPVSREESFGDMTGRFLSILRRRDTTALSEFVSLEQGIFVIDNSRGAIPEIVSAEGLDAAAGVLFGADSAALACAPAEGRLPEVSCDNPPEFYDESGCFASTVNLLTEEHPWDFIEMEEAKRQVIIRAAARVSVTFIITAAHRYFFSLQEGKWALLFVDVRRRCSA